MATYSKHDIVANMFLTLSLLMDYLDQIFSENLNIDEFFGNGQVITSTPT